MSRHARFAGLDRRAVLRGGGVAVALPFLEAFAPRRATAAAAVESRKIIFFYTPNGQDTAYFRPTGTGRDFMLGKLLAPLERLKGDLILPVKLNNKAGIGNPSGTNGHNAGITSMLTSTTINPQADLPTVNKELRGYATGPSIDWTIAQKAPGAAALKMPLIVAGAETRGYEFGKRDPYSYVSYRAAGASGVNGAEENPYNLFKSLFADYQGGGAAVDRMRAQRKSILDFVATRYSPQSSALVKGLGAADKQRLDQHLTAVRELEMRVAVKGGACAAPTLGGSNDYRTPALDAEAKLGLAGAPGGECSDGITGKLAPVKGGATFPDLMRAHTDLVLMAFSCGLSRVATLQHSGAQSGPSHVWACAPGSHHGITHSLGDPKQRDYEAKVTMWYASQFAYLVDSLKKTPDPTGGTMFDHSLVVWFTEMADAAGHTHTDLCFVLAGTLGGALKTGQVVAGGGRSQADLYVTLMNAMGIDAKTFGDPKFCAGALPGLT